MTSARQFRRRRCAARTGAHNAYAHHSLTSKGEAGWKLKRVSSSAEITLGDHSCKRVKHAA
jgi:hypothetical protein